MHVEPGQTNQGLQFCRDVYLATSLMTSAFCLSSHLRTLHVVQELFCLLIGLIQKWMFNHTYWPPTRMVKFCFHLTLAYLKTVFTLCIVPLPVSVSGSDRWLASR